MPRCQEWRKASWCTVPMLSSMAQHLSHLLAPNLLCSNPSSCLSLFLYLTSTVYIFKSFSISFSHWHTHTHKHSLPCVSVCVWVLQAQGPQSQPSHSVQLTALSTLSVHLSLCSPLPLSSCSPSRPISQPSTHS